MRVLKNETPAYPPQKDQVLKLSKAMARGFTGIRPCVNSTSPIKEVGIDSDYYSSRYEDINGG